MSARTLYSGASSAPDPKSSNKQGYAKLSFLLSPGRCQRLPYPRINSLPWSRSISLSSTMRNHRLSEIRDPSPKRLIEAPAMCQVWVVVRTVGLEAIIKWESRMDPSLLHESFIYRETSIYNAHTPYTYIKTKHTGDVSTCRLSLQPSRFYLFRMRPLQVQFPHLNPYSQPRLVYNLMTSRGSLPLAPDCREFGGGLPFSWFPKLYPTYLIAYGSVWMSTNLPSPVSLKTTVSNPINSSPWHLGTPHRQPCQTSRPFDPQQSGSRDYTI